jgi:hypothetical protein
METLSGFPYQRSGAHDRTSGGAGVGDFVHCGCKVPRRRDTKTAADSPATLVCLPTPMAAGPNQTKPTRHGSAIYVAVTWQLSMEIT